MDLHSLLNSQKENNLTLSELKDLLERRDHRTSLETIQSTTAYIYPKDKQETFYYFNTFTQLILSITNNTEPINLQYTKSIILDSLRQCMNGLLKQNGISWLQEFPRHFTHDTWTLLKSNDTILVCLYGMVLALTRQTEFIVASSDWMLGILQFMQADSAAILTHLWLNVCCVLDEAKDLGAVMPYEPKKMYLEALEKAVAKKTIDPQRVQEMLTVLKETNTDFLAAKIDAEIGNALPRPAFTRDELVLSYISLENECRSSGHYLHISKIYHQLANTFLKKDRVMTLTRTFTNPLLTAELSSHVPSDKYAQTEAIRQGALFWIKCMSTMTPSTFDMHLKDLIQKHYPTDRKTVLDLVLADWTLRDRFHRHQDFILQTFITQLQTTTYNRRTSPYYAFVQLFNIPDEHQENQASLQMTGENETYYQMKSGARIDLSQFSNCSDLVLMHGCFLMLKKLTVDGFANRGVSEWMSDSLQSASADIVRQYAKWLCDALEHNVSSECYSSATKLLLTTCVAQSANIVPTLLESFSEQSLTWLLKHNTSHAGVLLHFFDDGPQVSKNIVVTQFFQNKTKACVDLLLGYLREQMSGIDPKMPRSRAWFKHHFLCNILMLVGEDKDGKSVASRIFRQLFKTRDDFEWYFSTPLVPTQPILFKSLALAHSHDIYSVKHTGLAAMFQELVRLNDSTKKERLLNIWFDLWISMDTFTVPVSWILHCAGLYDQAPVLVKQMIKRFVEIGIQPRQEQDILRLAPERKFLDRMMDLVLLSDTPEPDSLFELVLNVTCDQPGSFHEINTAIVNIMIELSEELELEILASASPPPPPPPRFRKKVAKKKRNMTRMKLATLMKKHEEELEKYLTEKNEKINNAIKALTTLAQRIFSFLLRLLNNTSSLASIDSTNKVLFIRQEIQQQLVNIPLYYEPLAKLAKLITQPEDLHEDIQTAIELSVEYLKKQSDKTIFEASQKILK